MTTAFTPARIAEIRSFAPVAAPTPYRLATGDTISTMQGYKSKTVAILSHGRTPNGVVIDYTQAVRNGEFIVAACNYFDAALDEIERLRAENARLRETLEPFAIEASMMSARSGIPDGDIADDVWVSVRLGTCRRARRALDGGEA